MANPFTRVRPTLAISNAAIYAAGDSIGGLFTLDISSLAWGGILNSLVVTDANNQKAPFTLYLFHSTPTTVADNAAWSPTYADLKRVLTTISVAALDYVTVNGIAQAVKTQINFTLPGDAINPMPAIILTSGTPTYLGASNLDLVFGFAPQLRE